MQSFDVSRANLSDSAEAAVRSMIVAGDLAAGERINEVHLAERLALSRTPLREALNRLAAEGALEARPRLGYYVAPLTVEDFEQSYGVRPILDPEALRLAGLPGAEQIGRLHRLNRRLAVPRAPAETIALDDAWHLVLLEHCPNRLLVGLIETMMARTRRYELALMRDSRNVKRAGASHERIMAALEAGDLHRACAALRDNLMEGKAPVVAWLQAREAAAGAKRAA